MDFYKTAQHLPEDFSQFILKNYNIFSVPDPDVIFLEECYQIVETHFNKMQKTLYRKQMTSWIHLKEFVESHPYLFPFAGGEILGKCNQCLHDLHLRYWAKRYENNITGQIDPRIHKRGQ